MYQLMEVTMLEASLLSNYNNSPGVSSIGSSITTYHRRHIRQQNCIHHEAHLLEVEEQGNPLRVNEREGGLSTQSPPLSPNTLPEGGQTPVLSCPIRVCENEDTVLTTVVVPVPQLTTSPLNYPHLIFNYYRVQQQLSLGSYFTHQPQQLSSKCIGSASPTVAESRVGFDAIYGTLRSEEARLGAESLHAPMHNNDIRQESFHSRYSSTETSLSNISTINMEPLGDLSGSVSPLLSHTTLYQATEMLAGSGASSSPSIVDTQPPSPYARYDLSAEGNHSSMTRINELPSILAALPSRSLSMVRGSSYSSQLCPLEVSTLAKHSHRRLRERNTAYSWTRESIGSPVPPDYRPCTMSVPNTPHQCRDARMTSTAKKGSLPRSYSESEWDLRQRENLSSPSCVRSSRWAPCGVNRSLGSGCLHYSSPAPSQRGPRRNELPSTYRGSFLNTFICTRRDSGSPKDERSVWQIREGSFSNTCHCTRATETPSPVVNYHSSIMRTSILYDELTEASFVLPPPRLVNPVPKQTMVTVADDHAGGQKQRNEFAFPVHCELDSSGRSIDDGEHNESDMHQGVMLGPFQSSFSCHVEIMHGNDCQEAVGSAVMVPNPQSHLIDSGVVSYQETPKDKVVTLMCNREEQEIAGIDANHKMTYSQGGSAPLGEFPSLRQSILLRCSADGGVHTECMPPPSQAPSHRLSNYFFRRVQDHSTRSSNGFEYKKGASESNLEEFGNPFLCLYSERVWGRRCHQTEKYQDPLKTMNECSSASESFSFFHKASSVKGSNDIMTAVQLMPGAENKRSLSRTPSPSPRDFASPMSMLVTPPAFSKGEAVATREHEESAIVLSPSASTERSDGLALIRSRHVSLLRYYASFMEDHLLRASGSVSRQRSSWAPRKHNRSAAHSLFWPQQSNGGRSSAASPRPPFAQQLFEDTSDCNSQASSVRRWSASKCALVTPAAADSAAGSGALRRTTFNLMRNMEAQTTSVWWKE